ncbi:MAG: STAS domain-containing protein [Eubacteriales bacterium]|nr:STAS domain-containing protein [Eubacteriales bacterium]
MKINHYREAEKLTVAIEGKLDTTTAPEFEKTLGEILDGVSELVLDMTNLEYISSAGLRVILKVQKVMYNQGKMKLLGVNETVMEVFEITGFSNILKIV